MVVTFVLKQTEFFLFFNNNTVHYKDDLEKGGEKIPVSQKSTSKTFRWEASPMLKVPEEPKNPGPWSMRRDIGICDAANALMAATDGGGMYRACAVKKHFGWFIRSCAERTLADTGRCCGLDAGGSDSTPTGSVDLEFLNSGWTRLFGDEAATPRGETTTLSLPSVCGARTSKYVSRPAANK